MANRILKSKLVHEIFLSVPNLHKVASDVGNTFFLFCAKIEENLIRRAYCLPKIIEELVPIFEEFLIHFNREFVVINFAAIYRQRQQNEAQDASQVRLN